MSDGTKIQWTDASWTPIRARRKDGQPNKGPGGWACQRVSAGCQNCYAATINKRRGTGFDYDAKGIAASDIYLDEKALTQPLHWRRPRRIFVCSMTDLFGEWVPDEMIDRVFAVMALTPQHTYQVLTKRPERMREYLTGEWTGFRQRERMAAISGAVVIEASYPLPNVWLGVSAEDQERGDQRIPVLLDTPAAVRFVSAEPLLGPLQLEEYLHDSDCWARFREPPAGLCICNEPREEHISWVIVGGESGPGARPCDVEWIRSIVRQCQEAGVAVFYKQGGYHNRCPHDRKGGHFECFPDDLKVREMPR